MIFFHTPLHSAPLLRGPRRNIVIPFGAEKLEWWGYPIVKKTLRICVTVYTQYRRVTDRQTDGQTDILPRHSPRYAYASRGKNYWTNSAETWQHKIKQNLSVLLKPKNILSRVSTLTRDIDIAILSIRPSVCLSVRPSRSGVRWKWLSILSYFFTIR